MLKQGPIPVTSSGDIEGRLLEFSAKIGQLNIGLANFMSSVPAKPVLDMPNKDLRELAFNNKPVVELLVAIQKAADVVTSATAKERAASTEFDILVNQVKNLTISTAELQRTTGCRRLAGRRPVRGAVRPGTSQCTSRRRIARRPGRDRAGGRNQLGRSGRGDAEADRGRPVPGARASR